VLVCTVALACAAWAAPAWGQLSTYIGQRPIAGDAHRHAGSADSERELGATPPTCPHESGACRARSAHRARLADVDWLSPSFHDYLLTGEPNAPAYRFWTDPASRPRVDPTFGLHRDAFPLGFADFALGGSVSPPWNEVASLSSVAETRSVPGSFAAIAGREYTAPLFLGRANHKTVVPRGATDRICGSLSEQGKRHRCATESDLYRWSAAQGAALIQAHPGEFTPYQAQWHPVSEPRGMSDAFVFGIEILNDAGVQWEDGYRNALDAGYRFFPAYGSDVHHMQGGVPDCSDGAPPTLEHGATVCWTPDADWDAGDLVDAMRDRDCYVSRGWKPTLQVDACAAISVPPGASCIGPPTRMGGTLDAPGNFLRVRVHARATTCATGRSAAAHAAGGARGERRPARRLVHQLLRRRKRHHRRSLQLGHGAARRARRRALRACV
jgi:hypothetical protein